MPPLDDNLLPNLQEGTFLMRSAIAPPRNAKFKPHPPLSASELLQYSEEHNKLIVELGEAVRELSALLLEISLLLASHEHQNNYQ
jgi:hypothetical protein